MTGDEEFEVNGVGRTGELGSSSLQLDCSFICVNSARDIADGAFGVIDTDEGSTGVVVAAGEGGDKGSDKGDDEGGDGDDDEGGGEGNDGEDAAAIVVIVGVTVGVAIMGFDDSGSVFSTV